MTEDGSRNAEYGMQKAADAGTPRAFGAPERILAVREAMSAQELPVMLFSHVQNIGWLTGFTGSNAYVLLTQNSALFATDSRYTEQAATECPGFELVKLETSAPEEVTSILETVEQQRIGFESERVSFHLHQAYLEKLPSGIDLVPVRGMIEALRLVKDAGEIALIREACSLADRMFDKLLTLVRPGKTEREVALDLEWFTRADCGAEMAFQSIVASGPNSALPHARPTNRRIAHGDLVVLDFGARWKGYCSDITRTVSMGEPGAEQRKIYRTVLDAKARATEAALAGVDGKAVDAVGRDYIKEAGYGDYFGHGLGHSLGREVHDGAGFSIKSELTVAANMVLTMEPGIYVPNQGGVRVEDDLLIQAAGPPEVLTKSSTDLIVL